MKVVLTLRLCTQLSDFNMAFTASRRGLLDRLRVVMGDRNLAAYIVPHSDQHQSEYIRDCDERLAFVSNFTGSAGTAVVFSTESEKGAALWTDGRYHVQGELAFTPAACRVVCLIPINHTLQHTHTHTHAQRPDHTPTPFAFAHTHTHTHTHTLELTLTHAHAFDNLPPPPPPSLQLNKSSPRNGR
jgi:hypothetical protein